MRRPQLITTLFFSTSLLFLAACDKNESKTQDQAGETAALESEKEEAKKDEAQEEKATGDEKVAVEDANTELRVVSIGASVTETIFALGGGDQIVGVDRTSVYPEAVHKLQNVGLPGQISVEGVAAMKPSLVIADIAGHGGPQTEAPALDKLESLGIKVIRFKNVLTDLEAASERISQIGEALGRSEEGKKLAESLSISVKKALSKIPEDAKSPKVLFVYARGPRTLLMGGKNTAADAILSLAGAENVAKDIEGFKPMNAEVIIESEPDIIVIPARGLESLGGLEQALKIPGIGDTPAGKAKRIIPVDDLEILTFGPRLGEGLQKLVEAFYPEAEAQ